MSEENKLTAEQIVEQKLKEATGKDVKFSELAEVFEMKYNNLYKTLLSESHSLSARELIRGLFNAVDIGVDSGLAPRLVNEKEAKFGGYLGQLLDMRNTILAVKQNKQEEENSQGDTNVTTEQ